MAPQASSPEIAREALLQKQLVYKKFIEDQDRLFDVSFPLKAANAEFCGRKAGPLMGMTGWSVHSVGREMREAAVSLYNLQDRLAVQFIARNSPAARAGILSGDIIVAINGQSLPADKTALKLADSLLKQSGYNSGTILIERGGDLLTKTVKPIAGCDFPVTLDQGPEINAFADGERIVVSKGMLRFVENDTELALVISHELAHSALLHVDKLKQNAMAGALGGLAIDSIFAAAGVGTGGQFSQIGGQIGVSQYSVAFEQEADYVGMYFMERAGISSAGVANFWRRMAAEGVSSASRRTSHPTSSERFLAIERTHAEIARKKANRLPLVPNLLK
jgi:membrane-associated protease RseP (regulator of RpoE activity)